MPDMSGWLLASLLWSFAAPAADDADPCVHVVVAGDTTSEIAVKNGLSQRELVDLNPALAKNKDALRLGQKLKVCSKSAKKSDDDDKPDDDAPKKSKDKDKPDEPPAKRCGKAGHVVSHEVGSGDTLAGIAEQYDATESDIKSRNWKVAEHPDKLSVGTKIRVCPQIAPRYRDKIEYTVTAGENIGTIAEKFGASPRELDLWQQGKLKDRNAIREGQKLVVWADGRIVRGFGGQDVDTGRLADGTQLPPGKHYVVKWEAGAWGTGKTVRAIQQAVADYKRKSPSGPKVHIGDISKRGGGKFPPHISHQHGRDVDIGYVLVGKDAEETKFRTANAKTLDVPRTWALIKAFVDTDEVTYIFMDYRVQKLLYEHAEKQGVSEDTLDELFQYPRGRGRVHGIIRHWRGHSNHFHVRFRP
jgi:LysM repeat protein